MLIKCVDLKLKPLKMKNSAYLSSNSLKCITLSSMNNFNLRIIFNFCFKEILGKQWHRGKARSSNLGKYVEPNFMFPTRPCELRV